MARSSSAVPVGRLRDEVVGRVVGALSSVATVIGELADENKLDADSLVDVAGAYPLAVARRVGWLLDRDAEFVDTADLADRLHQFIASRSDQRRRVVDLLAPAATAGARRT